MTQDMDVLRVFVDLLPEGYVVQLTVNDKPWKQYGPYDNLDDANMACREILARANKVADRFKQ